jgi:hypothetical protein
MNLTELERDLLNLPTPMLRRVLIQLVAETTIAARRTYDVGTDEVTEPTQLRRFNEALHRIAAALRHCDEGESATAVEMICAQVADDDSVSRAVRKGLDRARHVATPDAEKSKVRAVG